MIVQLRNLIRPQRQHMGVSGSSSTSGTGSGSQHHHVAAAIDPSGVGVGGGGGANSAGTRKTSTPAQDFVGFFAALNVNMRLIATIAQEMISFYALCDRLKEDFNPNPNNAQTQAHPSGQLSRTQSQGQQRGRSSRSGSGSRSGSRTSSLTHGDGASTGGGDEPQVGSFEVKSVFLTQLLTRMRTMREADLTQQSTGRPSNAGVAVNKMLERTQAAG